MQAKMKNSLENLKENGLKSTDNQNWTEFNA